MINYASISKYFSCIFLLLLSGCLKSNVSTNLQTPIPMVSPVSSEVASANPTIMPSEEISTQGVENRIGLLIYSHTPGIGALFIGENGEILRNVTAKYSDLSFSPDKDHIYGFSTFGPDGSGFIVDVLDYSGNILNHRTIQIDPTYYSLLIFGLANSPDGKWINYIIPSGDNNFDPRFSSKRDLWLLNIQEEGSQPIKITENGGMAIGGGSWSPDGRYLAYTDMDTSGIIQIFNIDIGTGKKSQLSSFDEGYRGLEISKISYSPSGEKLGYIGTYAREHRGQVGFIKLDEQLTIQAKLPNANYIPSTPYFWWSEEGIEMALLLEGRDLKNIYNNDLIVWFDTNSGEIIRTFPEKEDIGYVIEIMFPLDDISRIGFYGFNPKDTDKGASAYSYDIRNKMIKALELPDLCCYPYSLITP